jgi:transcriptional regulator with XRE-family HTH domain
MKRGRPSLEPEQAQRVLDALNELLRGKFGGNASALGRELTMSQSAVSQLVSGKNAPSFSTAERVAKVLGKSVLELLEGAPRPEVDRDLLAQKRVAGLKGHRNLLSALRYVQHEQVVSTETEGVAMTLASHLPDDLSTPTWIAIMLDIENAQRLTRPNYQLDPSPPDTVAKAEEYAVHRLLLETPGALPGTTAEWRKAELEKLEGEAKERRAKRKM